MASRLTKLQRKILRWIGDTYREGDATASEEVLMDAGKPDEVKRALASLVRRGYIYQWREYGLTSEHRDEYTKGEGDGVDN
ncbi:MAG: hypothetical protein WC962_09660 [Phycisphaerae bacterium]|jgi:DNA-binding GntR family transcriptional regulator